MYYIIFWGQPKKARDSFSVYPICDSAFRSGARELSPMCRILLLVMRERERGRKQYAPPPPLCVLRGGGVSFCAPSSSSSFSSRTSPKEDDLAKRGLIRPFDKKGRGSAGQNLTRKKVEQRLVAKSKRGSFAYCNLFFLAVVASS